MSVISPYIVNAPAPALAISLEIDTTKTGNGASANDTFILKAKNDPTYNAIVDWG